MGGQTNLRIILIIFRKLLNNTNYLQYLELINTVILNKAVYFVPSGKLLQFKKAPFQGSNLLEHSWQMNNKRDGRVG